MGWLAQGSTTASRVWVFVGWIEYEGAWGQYGEAQMGRLALQLIRPQRVKGSWGLPVKGLWMFPAQRQPAVQHSQHSCYHKRASVTGHGHKSK